MVELGFFKSARVGVGVSRGKGIYRDFDDSVIIRSPSDVTRLMRYTQVLNTWKWLRHQPEAVNWNVGVSPYMYTSTIFGFQGWFKSRNGCNRGLLRSSM